MNLMSTILRGFLLTCLAVSGAVAMDYSNSLTLTYTDGAGRTLPYRLFLPPGHDQPGNQFPVVLFLHGAGERGTNNTSQLAYIDGLINEARTQHPAFLLVPQAPTNDYWGEGFGGFSSATAMTLQVLQQIEQQYLVDTSRRYVTGLSMGGFGTWDLVAGLPSGFFEAAVPMSAYGDPSRGPDYLGTRIWAFHGAADSVVPVEPDRATIEAIRSAGGDPLYTETAGDHGIWQPIYNDATGELYDWMFDGIAPSIPEWIYDPTSGSVMIDASGAPGGRIASLRYVLDSAPSAVTFTIPEFVYLDGAPIPSETFFSQRTVRNLTHNSAATGGFAGVLTLPNVLPIGLTYQQVHAISLQNFYTSPQTGPRSFRYFDIQLGSVAAVPEPGALLLALTLALGIVGMHRP